MSVQTGPSTRKSPQRVHVLESQQQELSQRSESLAETEKFNRQLQLQLNEINRSLVEVQKSVVTLQTELSQKNVSLTEAEKFNRALQFQLSQRCESLVKIEALQSEIAEKIGILAGTQKPTAVLESESSLAEVKERNRELQLQLNVKNVSLTDVQKSMVALQSELNQKMYF